jgi:hypothetical protein
MSLSQNATFIYLQILTQESFKKQQSNQGTTDEMTGERKARTIG